jgi:hypothetical protein
VVPGGYCVGRYEHFDRAGASAVNLGDLGVAWIPRPYLHLKAGYRFASNEAVKRFVASERKAIDYITPGCVDDSVRVVLHLTAPR